VRQHPDSLPATPSAGAGDTIHGTAEPLPLATDLRARTTIGGYKLEEVVGRGGMGVVYRARHLLLERTAAVKLLSPQLAADEAFRERFVRESRMAAALEHPHVVPVYDAGEQDGLLYIAMRYVDGTDLGTLLDREGALEPSQALTIAGQVGSALDVAHERSIVHRDVKPANVLLDERGAYLSDFGLTKSVSSETRLTAHGQFVGTIDYMPPEQIEGARLDPRSDVYAFGCVLYHTLTGAPPFQRDSAVSVMYAQLRDRPPPISGRGRGLPAALDPVFARALAKRSGDRYGTCLELVEAARTALGVDADASPPRLVPRQPLRTILVAARDQRLRSAVRGMLGSERFAFAEAQSRDEVLDTAREARPDVVLLDWGLPGSPLELCRELRDNAGLPDMKIIVLASRSEAPDEDVRAAAGVDGLVVWPSSSLQLQLKIGELLTDEVGD
jgi:serine/threonine protein kinase